MIHFSIFKIPVSVQPYFWITMALIGGAFNATTPELILQLLLFMIAGFISILIHELGHALTIKAFKVPTSITLQAFGGYASYPAGILNRKQSFVVTAAGPAAQLLLALGVYLLLINVPALTRNVNGAHFLHSLLTVSVFWALLNLLPVLPLDGGQLVNAVLGPARIKITLWITIVTAMVSAAAMLYFFKTILFPIFMGMFAYQAYQALKENDWR
jgi:Zn-dependent protease